MKWDYDRDMQEYTCKRHGWCAVVWKAGNRYSTGLRRSFTGSGIEEQGPRFEDQEAAFAWGDAILLEREPDIIDVEPPPLKLANPIVSRKRNRREYAQQPTPKQKSAPRRIVRIPLPVGEINKISKPKVPPSAKRVDAMIFKQFCHVCLISMPVSEFKKHCDDVHFRSLNDSDRRKQAEKIKRRKQTPCPYCKSLFASEHLEAHSIECKALRKSRR